MISDSERAAFNEIAAGIGRLDEPTPPYLMPWWLPPGLLVFYGMLLGAAGVIYWIVPMTVTGMLLAAVGGLWARHRRARRFGYRPELSYLRPFIS